MMFRTGQKIIAIHISQEVQNYHAVQNLLYQTRNTAAAT